jgi:hypothetical protein
VLTRRHRFLRWDDVIEKLGDEKATRLRAILHDGVRGTVMVSRCAANVEKLNFRFFQ